jgi:hypothetical protein
MIFKPIFTGAESILGKAGGFNSNFIRPTLLFVAAVCVSVSAEGQTPKSSPPKPNDAPKALVVKDLDKPFTKLSFEKVRVMAVTPEVAPEKPMTNPTTSPGAGGQTQNPAYSANAGGSNFSFGMYLAPPSSSFGTLVRSMQDQVEQRGQSRDSEARQTGVDKMLGYVGARPVTIGPVNLKLSLGTGSVHVDALDLYDDRLLEKPEFVKHNEITP